MVSLNEIKSKKEQILAIARSYGADNLRVFGSFVNGTPDENSDLDLLVRMAPQNSLIERIGLMQELEKMLHIKVDVVNEKALDKNIKQQVLEQGIPL
mgnify:CR=1 FL=1